MIRRIDPSPKITVSSGNGKPTHEEAARQLAEHAREIRALSRLASGSILEIGRRLIEAKALAGHGNWLPWLEREFGWSERTAQNFMKVAERLPLIAKSAKFADLNIDLAALYRLAAPSTPAEVVEKVVARGREGRRITYEYWMRAENPNPEIPIGRAGGTGPAHTLRF